MIVDANILLYARNSSDPRHEPARNWLEAALNGDTRVGLPWSTLGAFFRIATNPRAFPDPLAPDTAWQQIMDWLAAPSSWIPEPSDRYAQILGKIVVKHRVTGPAMTDAMLAALAIDHGVELISTDSDFKAFEGLRHVDPLG